jgi:hypothetical protein
MPIRSLERLQKFHEVGGFRGLPSKTVLPRAAALESNESDDGVGAGIESAGSSAAPQASA